jgi:hypothetical protein
MFSQEWELTDLYNKNKWLDFELLTTRRSILNTEAGIDNTKQSNFCTLNES